MKYQCYQNNMHQTKKCICLLTLQNQKNRHAQLGMSNGMQITKNVTSNYLIMNTL